MQKTMIATVLTGVFVLASVGTSFAAPAERERAQERGPRPGAAPRFAAMDTDGDGEVSKKEFMQASRERAKIMFERLDADGDGVITQEEIRKAGQAMREGRGQGMRDGRGRPEGGGDADADQPQRRQRRRPAVEDEN